jgi:hypothetical protein
MPGTTPVRRRAASSRSLGLTMWTGRHAPRLLARDRHGDPLGHPRGSPCSGRQSAGNRDGPALPRRPSGTLWPQLSANPARPEERPNWHADHARRVRVVEHLHHAPLGFAALPASRSTRALRRDILQPGVGEQMLWLNPSRAVPGRGRQTGERMGREPRSTVKHPRGSR